MKKYRCPYCGEEAFHLLIKLGLNTRFDAAPRCAFCKKVSFRNFVIGGHFLYDVILSVSALLTACGIFVSVKWGFAIGTLLFPIAFVAFYLFYNYYFCYFDRVKKDGSDEIIYLQLKEFRNSWPDIRKGEIYKIGLLKPSDFASARDGFAVAMVEDKNQDKLQLRILSKPPVEHFELKGEVAIYCYDKMYAATVITPPEVLKLHEQAQKDDNSSDGIEIINMNCKDI